EGGEGNVLPGADRGGETAGFNPPSHRLRVGEFEVAKSGGIWVAIRERNVHRKTCELIWTLRINLDMKFS
nr:hypothetical protein [Rhodoferax sp.]